MQLKILSTGSKANCYELRCRDSSILLDAGLPIAQISKAVSFTGLQACFITHEHGDHGKAAADISRRGVQVITSAGTAQALKLTGAFVTIVKSGDTITTGDWTAKAFDTRHDAKEPLGFLIKNRKTQETLVYATDTYYLRYRFPGTHYWIVEANYIDETLDQQIEAGSTTEALANRLRKSHMSLNRLVEALQANDLTETRKIVLVHLSDSRSDERIMQQTIERATGKPTVAATHGEIINLEITPF